MFLLRDSRYKGTPAQNFLFLNFPYLKYDSKGFYMNWGLGVLLKRGIGGVYHSVSEKYLQSCTNEYGFRYNHRKDEKPMFLQILSRLVPSLRAW